MVVLFLYVVLTLSTNFVCCFCDIFVSLSFCFISFAFSCVIFSTNIFLLFFSKATAMQLVELVILVKDLALLHPNSRLETIIEYVLSNAVRFEERDSVRKLLNETFLVTNLIQAKDASESNTEIDRIVEQFVHVKSTRIRGER